ncbi:hypothetical protein FRC01_012318 [Tulasnella sp. 417]|nr:hypothetical protein FRC01_012318 [Tulasnella sp. 417]
MVNVTVSGSFFIAFDTLLRGVSQISEINLQSLQFEQPGNTEALVRGRWFGRPMYYRHQVLRRVSVRKLEAPLLSGIMCLLENYQCKFIEVGDLDPEDLTGSITPCSTIGRILFSLPQDFDISFKQDVSTAGIYWRTREMVEKGGKGGYHWQSGRIEFRVRNASNLVLLIQSLSALGLRQILDDFSIVTNREPDNPSNEGNTKVMILEPEIVVWALEKLCTVTCGELGSIQYPRPYLEELILTRPCSGPPQQGWDAIEYKLCHFVVWRQTVARHDEGRVSRIKKLGVPAAWIPVVEAINRLSPDFSEIEIYASDGNTS